jgi:fluoride exporter
VKWVLLFVGGGLGSALRFGLSLAVDARLGPRFPFPWGTLAVNLSGCFAIGVLATLADTRVISPSARLFLVTGLLGGFTTFSAFGMETFQLLQDGRAAAAAANAAASVTAGVLAVAAGAWLTRALA